MDARDADTFARAFHRAAMVLQLKLSKADLQILSDSYFRILQAFDLAEVLTALEKCCRSASSFPRPVEVLARLSTPDGPASTPAVGLGESRRTMSVSELNSYGEAAATHFEKPPCGCSTCVAAGVSDKPLRFVPTLLDDGDTEERAINPQTGRYDVVGHWAHGAELARWYAAREAFYAHKRASKFARVRIGAEREPGEEG